MLLHRFPWPKAPSAADTMALPSQQNEGWTPSGNTPHSSRATKFKPDWQAAVHSAHPQASTHHQAGQTEPTAHTTLPRACKNSVVQQHQKLSRTLEGLPTLESAVMSLSSKILDVDL